MRGILIKMSKVEISDYAMVEETEDKETTYKRKADAPTYSQMFGLNGQIEVVRKYVDSIGAIKVKSSSPETHEEVYQKGSAFIAIHPSRDCVSVGGVEKEVMKCFEEILGGKK